MVARRAPAVTAGALVSRAGLGAWIPALTLAARDGLLGAPHRCRTRAPDCSAGMLAQLDRVIRATLDELADGVAAADAARPAPRRTKRPDDAA
jgi:hypothetical protein